MGVPGRLKRPGSFVPAVLGMQVIERAARAAALDPEAWSALLHHVSAAFSCRGVVLGFVDVNQRALVHVESAGLDLSDLTTWTEYRRNIWRHDKHAHLLTDVERTRVYSDADYGLAHVAASDEYIRWLDRLGVLHHLSFAVREGPLVGSLGVHRSRSDGPFSVDERQRMQSISGGVEHSLRISLKQSLLALQTFWDGLTTHANSELCLLDGCGRVLRTTSAFFGQPGGAIFTRAADHQLKAHRHDHDNRLRKALDAALCSGNAHTSYLALSNGSEERMLVKVKPVAATSAFRLHNQARALVELHANTVYLEQAAALLKEIYGTTAAEARVAIALARGDTIADISNDLGVSRETVRVHLKRLFSKTETNRQAQIVGLVSTLSMRS